jgi:CspA family cold shock protein
MSVPQKHTGALKWFNARKGFGFITPDDPGPSLGRDVFLFCDDVKTFSVRTGDRLQYSLVTNGDKGMRAIGIRRIERMEKMLQETEDQYAVRIANKVLDKSDQFGAIDPDSDLAVLARQFLQARERIGEPSNVSDRVAAHLAEHSRLCEQKETA